jgi:hypothetical protein
VNVNTPVFGSITLLPGIPDRAWWHLPGVGVGRRGRESEDSSSTDLFPIRASSGHVVADLVTVTLNISNRARETPCRTRIMIGTTLGL